MRENFGDYSLRIRLKAMVPFFYPFQKGGFLKEAYIVPKRGIQMRR